VTANLIVVAGPTASGKSALAVKLAQYFAGEVVNVDSVQLFRELSVGAGRLSQQEQGGVPHHMLDIRGPEEVTNVAWFIKEARQAIAEIQSRGKQIIVVAGTTLYLKGLLYGLAELPPGNEALRAELETLTTAELGKMLTSLDMESANRLHPNDRLRIIRAIEVARISEHKSEEFYTAHRRQESCFLSLNLVLCWERCALHSRIESRVRSMLSGGLVEEAKRVSERHGADGQWTKSVGYAECVQFLKGELPQDELLARILAKTRQLAKRQSTFWRNEPKKLGWNISPRGAQGYELDTPAGSISKGRGVVKPTRVHGISFEELCGRVQARLEEAFSQSEAWYLDADRL